MKPIIPTRTVLDILDRPGLSEEQIELCDMASRVSESFADVGTAEMHYIKKLVAAGFLIKTRSRSEPYQFTETSAVLTALWNAIQGAKAALSHAPSQPAPVVAPSGWKFEDHENGVVYVRAPSGKHVAIGYMAPGHKDCTDILRELIMAHLQAASPTIQPIAGEPTADLHPDWEVQADGSIVIRASAETMKEISAALSRVLPANTGRE